MSYTTQNVLYKSTNHGHISPTVWGPHFWFTLHLGAYHYPLNASTICVQRTSGFVLGIPYMLPCEECRTHALLFITSHVNELDEVCSGRNSLFNFYVDFHNAVNRRQHKKTYTYSEAYEMYSKVK